MVYSPNGITFTRGPGAYKIPGFADIPLEFNVSLLKGAPNPRAVYSSKVYFNLFKEIHSHSYSVLFKSSFNKCFSFITFFYLIVFYKDVNL